MNAAAELTASNTNRAVDGGRGCRKPRYNAAPREIKPINAAAPICPLVVKNITAHPGSKPMVCRRQLPALFSILQRKAALARA